MAVTHVRAGALLEQIEVVGNIGEILVGAGDG
jgi:hypothetical protein